MSVVLDFLVKIFESALETEGETLLDAQLQVLHDKNLSEYNAAIFGLNAGVIALSKLTSAKPGSIADIAVKALAEAVTLSAQQNGITLPTTTAVASIAAVKK